MVECLCMPKSEKGPRCSREQLVTLLVLTGLDAIDTGIARGAPRARHAERLARETLGRIAAAARAAGESRH